METIAVWYRLIYNQIFKYKLIRTFTEDVVYAQQFQDFRINAPEEIFRITSKFIKTKKLTLSYLNKK
jgi:hypothetical protein